MIFTISKNAKFLVLLVFFISIISLSGFSLPIYVSAKDEETLANIYFSANFIDETNNYTLTSIADYNNFTPCYYDNDNVTVCYSAIKGNTSSFTYYVGIGTTNSTFLSALACAESGGGVEHANISVYTRYKNGSLIPIDSISCSGDIKNSTHTINIDNTNNYYNYTIPIIFDISTTSPAGYANVNITEFKMVTPYSYIDQFTINISGLGYTNVSQIDVFVDGLPGFNDGTNEYDTASTRMYRISLTALSSYNLTAYLLKNNNALIKNIKPFQIASSMTSGAKAVTGAVITLSRYFPYGSSSIETPVAQCLSDPSGYCTIFMKLNTIYSFRTTAAGYNSEYTNNTAFSTFSSQGVELTPSSAGNMTSVVDGLTISTLPAYIYVSAPPVNVSCIATAGNGNMNYVNFTVYNLSSNNTGIFYSALYLAAPAGGTLTIQINNTGRWLGTCIYNFASNASGSLVNYTNTISLGLIIGNETMSGAVNPMFDDDGTKMLVGTTILMVSVVMITPYVGLGGAAIVGIIIMTMLTWVGFFPWQVFAIAFILLIVIMFLRGSFINI